MEESVEIQMLRERFKIPTMYKFSGEYKEGTFNFDFCDETISVTPATGEAAVTWMALRSGARGHEFQTAPWEV